MYRREPGPYVSTYISKGPRKTAETLAGALEFSTDRRGVQTDVRTDAFHFLLLTNATSAEINVQCDQAVLWINKHYVFWRISHSPEASPNGTLSLTSVSFGILSVVIQQIHQ
jgi:hypothetical protein